MTNEENCRIFSVFRPDSRIPLDYYVAKFDANSSVDFKNCPSRLERENNFKEFKAIYGTDTDMPTSGAGSEYGRGQRDEARRKKFGFKSKQYDPKSQPFVLKMGSGKQVKKMKGTKNGGVTKNAGYVAFVLTAGKQFISLPVSDWYNFAPVTKRVTLNIEEAEEQFSKRNKIYNHFAIMSNMKKNKREEDDDDEDLDGKPAKRQKRNRSDNDIETLSDSGEERDSDDEAPSGGKKNKKRNEKSDSDETVEDEKDEDDGMDEGREVDYLSESSDDDEDPFGEDMEELFGEEDEEEEHGDKIDDDDDDEDSVKAGEKKDDENNDDSDSDEDVDDLFGGESSGSKASVPPPVVKVETKGDTSVDRKRKSDGPENVTKRPKLEVDLASNSKESIEDFVRDCLKKKPTSAAELLEKLASNFSQSQSMNEIKRKLIDVMKKLKPQSMTIDGTMHFVLRN